MTYARLAVAVALAAAAGVAAFGVLRGTWAVGGSDSSCYALMADAFARRELQPLDTLSRHAPWPDPDRTFAPAGFIPSPVRAGAASPVCAPGFSLLLAAFHLVGGPDAIFLVTPLAGALLVWWAFVFGRRLDGPATGAGAAVLVATMPVLLFQVAQPMNDITVTALWTGLLVAATVAEPSRSWLMGAAAGVALLIRPNLAPSIAVAGVWLAATAWLEPGRNWRLAQRRVTAFALAAAPAVAVLLALNTALYGQPLSSGYGSPRGLFSLQHLLPNLRNYGAAIVDTQAGVPLAGFAAVLAVSRACRPQAWLTVLVAASMIGVYLLYQPFPEWWYLRFLLPALAPLTVLAVVAARRLAGRRRPVAATVILAVAVAGLAVFGVATARDRQAFDLHRLESRFRRAADVVRSELPSNATLVTVWQSGSVRFHAGRSAVLWDSLEPSALDEALAWLAAQDREPFLLLERWEEPLFRERFRGASEIGDLDWPPRFDIDRQVRIFKPSDRAAYRRGESIPTEYVVRRR